MEHAWIAFGRGWSKAFTPLSNSFGFHAVFRSCVMISWRCTSISATIPPISLSNTRSSPLTSNGSNELHPDFLHSVTSFHILFLLEGLLAVGEYQLEDVSIVPIIKPEDKLVEVGLKVLSGHSVIHANDCPFEQTPEALNAHSMDVAVHERPGMADSSVRVASVWGQALLLAARHKA